MPVRVLTDSSAAIPKPWLEGMPLDVLPLTVAVDGEEFRDGELSCSELVARAEGGDLPKTSAPSPGEYQQAIEAALQGSDGVLVITLPRELSVTYPNAARAVEEAGSPAVRVLDCRSAGAGEGLVALEAARAAAGGASLDETEARARFVASQVQVWATLARLDYLRRSGRVPAVAKMATGALNLHPVFQFVDGQPRSVMPARGDRRAAKRIFEQWTQARPGAPNGCRAIVFHAERPHHASELAKRIREAEPGAEIEVVEASAGMVTHTGPGLLGLAWWWQDPG